MDDIYSLSIVQQCRMLEAPLATDIVHQLLSDLPNAKSIIVKSKKLLLERDYDLLLVSAKAHPTARYNISDCLSYILEKDLGQCTGLRCKGNYLLPSSTA